MIEKIVEDCFPIENGSQREKEVILGEPAVVHVAKVTMLKERLGIGGNELIRMGVDKRLLGKTLLLLAEEMLRGGLRSELEIINFVQSI